MSESLVLVDGSSYLYRAFHALPPLKTSQGQPVGAIHGVISMLRKLADTTTTSRFAIIFDAPGKTFRDEIFPAYKANREAMPEDLKAQIKPLYEIIPALGFALIVVPGVEADDVIGTLARQAEKAGQSVVISTGDKDLAQLVTNQVTIVNTMNDSVMDPDGVKDKFGVPPALIIDFLALTGDSIDNVPGIPKCGPKTAAKWLQAYGNLDGVVEHAHEVGGKIGEILRTHLGLLNLSRDLVTIKTDCELDITLADLDRKPPDIDALKKIYTQLELNNFLKQLNQNDIAINEIPRSAVSDAVEKKYSLITNLDELNEWIEACSSKGVFSLDTETTSLVSRHASLVGISLSVSSGCACYIPVGHDSGMQLPIITVLERLSELLNDPSLTCIAHNWKYDLTILENVGMVPQCKLADTMLMSYVLDAAGSRHDLDTLARKHLGLSSISFDDVCGKGANQVSFNEVELNLACDYAAEDADLTLRLYKKFSAQLEQNASLNTIYSELEVPVMHILRKMENYGALLDQWILQKQSVDLGQRLEELKALAHNIVGRPFNLASPKQLQEILFEEQGLPIIKKTPKGAPSTNEEVLQELARDYPLPDLLIEHRSLTKLKGTYTDKLPKDCDPFDGRVHTSFHQAVTSTGRLSSSDPNLQNIPIRTEEGRRIRKAFVAPPNWTIVAADYSQIELRIMAHLSGDNGLVEAFSRGDDIHQSTASEVFEVDLMCVSTEQRRRAKAINFGLIYGMSAFGLARQLGIDRAEAARYIDTYFERYPGVRIYMDSIRAMAHDLGYVETVFGRRLTLPDINSKQVSVRQAAERAAINAPMQGTAADIIKKAMVKVDSAIGPPTANAIMLLQVHDELVFEVQNSCLENIRGLIKREMESACKLKVPLVVEIGCGANWFDAH